MTESDELPCPYRDDYGTTEQKIGRKIYHEALSGRRGFRDDHIGIDSGDDLWLEIFGDVGQWALDFTRTAPASVDNVEWAKLHSYFCCKEDAPKEICQSITKLQAALSLPETLALNIENLGHEVARDVYCVHCKGNTELMGAISTCPARKSLQQPQFDVDGFREKAGNKLAEEIGLEEEQDRDSCVRFTRNLLQAIEAGELAVVSTRANTKMLERLMDQWDSTGNKTMSENYQSAIKEAPNVVDELWGDK